MKISDKVLNELSKLTGEPTWKTIMRFGGTEVNGSLGRYEFSDGSILQIKSVANDPFEWETF